jgi:hypothetical protein
MSSLDPTGFPGDSLLKLSLSSNANAGNTHAGDRLIQKYSASIHLLPTEQIADQA